MTSQASAPAAALFGKQSSLLPCGAARRTAVFVFLGEGFGASWWQNAWKAGKIPGINERLPYGYFHAANESWSLTHSEDREESAPRRLLRRMIRKILGFDLIHAWNHREQLSDCDIVWTHTEREHLAVLCLWMLRPARNRPKLIAQSVWLFDRWSEFSPLRRWFFRRLMLRADLLTTLSPENLKEAQRLFPEKRCELVRIGIDAERLRPVVRKQVHRPIRILSLGTDMHRDWDTLIEAVGGWMGAEVRIASRTMERRREWPDNIGIVKPKTAREVTDLYDWADFVVLTLKTNLHASGITVIAEAILSGVPVICTDTGGLRAYFGEKEVSYVPLRDAHAVRSKIEELAANDDLRFDLTFRAQQRIVRDDLTSRGYATHYRRLSESLLRAALAISR